MANLDEFSRRMTVIAASVELGAERIVRKCVLTIDQAVVMATPVDTGRARSNWTVSRGSPSTRTRQPYAAGAGLGVEEGANAQAAINQGASEVAEYKLSDGPIYVSNSLPYIEALNDGHSAQAPAGFVQEAVQVGVQAVRGARILVEGSGRVD